MVRNHVLQRHKLAVLILFIIFFSLLCYSCGNPIEVFNAESIGMAFVSVPSGSFEMGAPSGEQGSQSDERPVHTVTFNYSFEFMKSEVTQGMWEEVMGTNPAHDFGIGENYPVYYVSWYDCQDFIDEMNNLDPNCTYRLPSEAEWEYACRAGSINRFFWGQDPDEVFIDDFAWWSGNAGGRTHPTGVGQINDNPWGLYDMSGNVWEWCQDEYHSNYYSAPSDGSPWISGGGSNRVVRGGSWYSAASICRSAERYSFIPGNSYNTLGFRLVRTAR